MFNKLNQHTQLNKILAPEQFRFRIGTNVGNVSFTLADTVLTSLNNWQQVVGIFCELFKASDCVNHVIRVNKLFQYGFGGICYYWIKSYRTNMKQKVNN